MIDANNSVPLMDRYGRRPDYVDGIGSSGMRSVGGLGGAVGYQEGSRKRQRSVEVGCLSGGQGFFWVGVCRPG
jgi:hypothetical protein